MKRDTAALTAAALAGFAATLRLAAATTLVVGGISLSIWTRRQR